MVVYKDKKWAFEDLLEKDKSVPAHIKNLQILLTEMFKGQKVLHQL